MVLSRFSRVHVLYVQSKLAHAGSLVARRNRPGCTSSTWHRAGSATLTMTTSGKTYLDWTNHRLSLRLVVSYYAPWVFPHKCFKVFKMMYHGWLMLVNAGCMADFCRTSIWGGHHTGGHQAGRETLKLRSLKDCQGHVPLVALLTLAGRDMVTRAAPRRFGASCSHSSQLRRGWCPVPAVDAGRPDQAPSGQNRWTLGRSDNWGYIGLSNTIGFCFIYWHIYDHINHIYSYL